MLYVSFFKTFFITLKFIDAGMFACFCSTEKLSEGFVDFVWKPDVQVSNRWKAGKCNQVQVLYMQLGQKG